MVKKKVRKFIVVLSEERYKGLLMNKAITLKSIQLQIEEAINEYLKIKE